MSEPARRLMDVAAFLTWEGGAGDRYELIAGHPVAMAPAHQRHGAVAARLIRFLGEALDARPACRVVSEAGIAIAEHDYFVADVAVTCGPSESPNIKDPILLCEVLSPSTESDDRRRKVAEYRQLPSVQEILLLDAERPYAEVHRRVGEMWVVDLLRGDDPVRLASVEMDLPLTRLYQQSAA